ncbi:hypothetical protein GGTG_14076 [Gaeumannomyces tritici R3-111a-1]|uniref:Uncharacterized protein n=1 Tax=Gaeumannomyces tritici (strain R3-111a-1) TaxID=644352 RepID=J3PKL4_GAET3|nr:hypothetical protein GGTG_14076 [Gaeumannomyces tritici R3-111a-1]EJT68345.1 hypothetical protein GGTG_14076 [Gaeumannomyces tritici R3-111a-1]
MDFPTVIARQLEKLHQRQVEDAAARYETGVAVLRAAAESLAPLQSPAQKRAGEALWRKLRCTLVESVLGQKGEGGPPPPQVARAAMPRVPNAPKGGKPPPKKHQSARSNRPVAGGANPAPIKTGCALTPVGPGKPESDGAAKHPVRATGVVAAVRPTPEPETEQVTSPSEMEVDSPAKAGAPKEGWPTPPPSSPAPLPLSFAEAAARPALPSAGPDVPNEVAGPVSGPDAQQVTKLVEAAIRSASGCEHLGKLNPAARKKLYQQALGHRARARGMLLNAQQVPELRARATAALEANLRAMKKLGWKGDQDPS